MAKSNEKHADPDETFTTFSIRLGARETALLREAMEQKGWTAANFIRRATLDRAAHIMNTSRHTEIDFEGWARRLAAQLCVPEVIMTCDDDLERTPMGPPLLINEVPYSFETRNQLEVEDVARLREAIHRGGAELLTRMLAECDRLRPGKKAITIDPEKL